MWKWSNAHIDQVLYAYLITYLAQTTLSLQQLWYYFLNYVYPNPPCQLSLWEEIYNNNFPLFLAPKSGKPNVLSFVWELYSSMATKHSLPGYFIRVYHAKFMCFSWNVFYPNVSHLESMLQVRWCKDDHTSLPPTPHSTKSLFFPEIL